MYVWEHYLRHKPGSNELWLLPGANHYLQSDQPDALTGAILAALGRTGGEQPGPLSFDVLSPIRVDQSAPQMRVADDAFRSDTR